MSIQNQIKDHIEIAKSLIHIKGQIEHMAELIIQTLKRGNKILLAGNGGSASDAQHIAAEMVGRFKIDRKAYPAISLTTDSSVLTSISNDYNYANVFARQVQGLSNKGDLLFLISTSGNSLNLIEAAKEAASQKIKTIALLGKGGGELLPMVDFAISIPSNDTARIQEMHILIAHLVVSEIESHLEKN